MDQIHVEGIWMRWLALTYGLVEKAMVTVSGIALPQISFHLRPVAFGAVRCYAEFYSESEESEWGGVWRLSLGLLNRETSLGDEKAFEPVVYELQLGQMFEAGDKTQHATTLLSGKSVCGALILPSEPLQGRKVLSLNGANSTVGTEYGENATKPLPPGSKAFPFSSFNTLVLAEQAARAARDAESKITAAHAAAEVALAKLTEAIPTA